MNLMNTCMVEFLIERAAILVYMRSIAILKVNGDKIKKNMP